MKLVAIAFILPLVYGEDCPDVTYQYCGENEMSCTIGYDENLCWLGNNCVASDRMIAVLQCVLQLLTVNLGVASAIMESTKMDARWERGVR